MRPPLNLPRRFSYALLVAALLAGPSLVTALLSELRDDPRLRPLSATEDRLAASSRRIETEGPYVRARIFWSGPAGAYAAPEDLTRALRTALVRRGVDVHIAVIAAPGAARTLVDFRAGQNAFGPFEVADAARHINPAVDAAHLAHAAGTQPR